MEFLLNNLWLLVVILAVVTVCGFFIYTFVKTPSDEQLTQVKEWLLYAVALAEKELGSGTGKLKLRYVYDMFLSRFSFLANLITFDAFSLMVDEALDEFKKILETNQSIANYVKE